MNNTKRARSNQLKAPLQCPQILIKNHSVNIFNDDYNKQEDYITIVTKAKLTMSVVTE